MQKKIYLMLGRIGDILNIIPAIKYESQQHNYKPKVIAAKKYADVLDGFNFLEKVEFPGEFTDTAGAVIFAQRNYPEYILVNCAVYGRNYKVNKKCSSFLREAWRLSHCPVAWGKLPLNVTNRNQERENAILNFLEISENKKPIVLTALSGTSSPFQYRELLLNKLTERLCEKFLIIDISELKAHRIYDLLSLYERARCLIAIDSAPLHLAEAMPRTPPKLPVVSLISDLKDTWHQSSWRRNHILRVLYSEVPNRMEEIIQAAIEGHNLPTSAIHLVTSSANNSDKETKIRKHIALASWTKERIIAGYGRWFLHFYESNKIPKVKKMIDDAYQETCRGDIILITNADINFVPGITGWILHETERHGAVYFHRHDFPKIEDNFISEDQVAEGKWYPGSDTFAFTKEWWKEHHEIFPDMYFAREAWDMIMRNMIKRSGGVEIHNAIYHEKHPSFWEAKQNSNCRENLINRSLAKKWLEQYGGDWNDWKFTAQQLKGLYK